MPSWIRFLSLRKILFELARLVSNNHGAAVFIPISENLSAGWKRISFALENRNAGAIKEVAESAIAGGAVALNVSGACRVPGELDNLCWMIETVAEKTSLPLCVDSASPEVQAAAASHYRNIRAINPPAECLLENGVPWMIINSIHGEATRFLGTLEVVKENNAGVIALAMDERGLPRDANGRVSAATALIEKLEAEGVSHSRIFIDPLVMPAGVYGHAGQDVLESVRRIRSRFPAVHITCGLSNVSHGMPAKERLNRAFLSMLIGAGLDSAIMDTTDVEMKKDLNAALALAGSDPNCAGFLREHRRDN